MSQHIKVIRVIARLNIGGPAIQAITLTGRLNPIRFRSMLVTGVEAPHEGNMLDLAERENVKPYVIPSLGREISFFGDLATIVRLIVLFRQERPHIVHTHTAKAGFVGRLAARLSGVKIIVHTYHGHVLRGYFSPLKTRLFIFLERWMGRYTDRIIAIAETQRKELLSFGIGAPEKYVVVPLGFELDRFREAADKMTADERREARIALGVPAEAVVVGIIARLTAIKNIARFLQAAKISIEKTRGSGSRLHFLVVGDGEERIELEELSVHLGIRDNVSFVGWMKDMTRAYPLMDIVALSSDNEGTPVTLIEGMASGVPVASTNVGGVRDLVQDRVTGLLVDMETGRESGPATDDGHGPDSGDPIAERLAAAISTLATDANLRASLGTAAQQHVLSRYTLDRLRLDIEELYAQLLVEKGFLTENE